MNFARGQANFIEDFCSNVDRRRQRLSRIRTL